MVTCKVISRWPLPLSILTHSGVPRPKALYSTRFGLGRDGQLENQGTGNGTGAGTRTGTGTGTGTISTAAATHRHKRNELSHENFNQLCRILALPEPSLSPSVESEIRS